MNDDEFIYFPISVEEGLLNILDVMEWNEQHPDNVKAVVMSNKLMADLLQRFLVLEQRIING